MPLTRVVMRLSRNPDAGYPGGDDDRGYVIKAPLDNDGKFDPELWKQYRKKCTVERFSPDTDEEADGWLTHKGDRWFFHWDEEDEGPDDGVHRLGEHTLRLGDYVTVHNEAEDEDLVYKVTETTRLKD